MARRRTTQKHPLHPEGEDFIGPDEPHFVALIPFPGFYESWLSGDIDSHEEQEAEHFAEKESGGYQGTEYPDLKQPEHCRIEQDEFHELFMKHMDYGKLHELLAACWVDAFANTAEEHLGFPLHLKFESMDSPSYYNFETDRCFAHIPVRVVKQVMRYTLKSKASRDILRKHIDDRHKSRSGFHSWYSTDTAEWATRMRDYLRDGSGDLDHNHFQTILEAAILHAHGPSKRGEGFDWEVYEAYSQDGIYQEWDQSMNWDAFDKACVEARKDKEEAWQEANPASELPPQPCLNTPDLFAGDKQ